MSVTVLNFGDPTNNAAEFSPSPADDGTDGRGGDGMVDALDRVNIARLGHDVHGGSINRPVLAKR